MSPSLVPYGGPRDRDERKGRFQWWTWTDADGAVYLRPRIIAALDATSNDTRTCADPAPKVELLGNSKQTLYLRQDLRHFGLVDDEDRLTEKGLAVRFAYRRNPRVKAGIFTPFGFDNSAVPF